MQIIKRQIYPLITFVTAFVVLLIAFAFVRVHPFGDSQMLIVDSWNQYYPFLQELHSKLRSGDSLFYSWNGGMGYNFYALWATYGMSPINLLSILFPREGLKEFMLLSTLIKVSTAGLFFSYYIKKTFNKNDLSIVMFGLFYSFSGFVAGYYWNIMWLDAVALLPLVVLGLRALVIEGKFILYTSSLALLIVSNYYIGFLVCIFIALYYVVLYFGHHGFRLNWLLPIRLFQFVFYSLCSGAVTAVVLLPAFYNLQLTHASGAGFPAVTKFYHPLTALLSRLLAFSTPTVKEGLPNIYSGLLPLLCLLVFFIATAIPLREKILNGLLMLFLLVSLNHNGLDYIWHGFHFPNQVPHRFAFVFVFLLISCGYRGYLELKTLTRKQLALIAIGSALFLLSLYPLSKGLVTWNTLAVSGVFASTYMAVYWLCGVKRLSRIGLNKWVFTVVALEIFVSALLGTVTAGTSTYANYPLKDEAIQTVLDDLREKDPDFYRIELDRWYTTNDPSLYGYKGVSFFSSTVNTSVLKYLKHLGVAALSESNRYLYATNTSLVNGLLNVGYLINRSPDKPLSSVGYTFLESTGDVDLYRVNQPLPLGFMVKSDLLDWHSTGRSPFQVQENFLKYATGLTADLYTSIAPKVQDFKNLKPTADNGIHYTYEAVDETTVGQVSLTYITEVKGQHYLYAYANKAHKMTVTVAETSTLYETRRGHIIDLGYLNQRVPVTVSFETMVSPSGYFDIELVSYNPAAYETPYALLADEGLDITEAKSGSITGTIATKQAGVLYTSIPYDPGWRATLNGNSFDLTPIEDAMLALPLDAGEHHLAFTFIPKGFHQGLVITAFALMVLMLAVWIKRKYNRSKSEG